MITRGTPIFALLHRFATLALVAVVFIQAVLAGQGLFGTSGFALHGHLGNLSFALGTLAAAVAMVGRMPRLLMTVSLATAVALFGQTGLGYVGRNQTWAASWHIPLGVTIFGLAVAQAMLTMQRRDSA